MKPLFYSIPPAGHKIPIKVIARSIRDLRKRSNDVLLGPIRDFLNTKYLLYLSSGRAAQWLILKALSKLNPDKSEVVIPAYTCPAVASAVLKTGFKPVLCDINLDDFGFKIENLKLKISKRTLAVIVVHLFGYPANINEVKETCKQDNVFVIEDAAQAFGNSSLDSHGRKLGLLGDGGFFSFGRGKPISIMHGGMLATNSEKIFLEAQKIYRRLNHSVNFPNLRYGLILGSFSTFSNPYMYWIPQRIPSLHLGETIFEPDFAISEGIELAGSVIAGLMDSFNKEKEVRQGNSGWYSASLNDLPLLEQVPSSGFPYLRYPLLVKDKNMRDRILDSLTSHGTGAALFYPSPLNELPGLKEILRDGSVYPNAKKLSETLITLPVHSGVTERIRNRIRSIVQQASDA